VNVGRLLLIRHCRATGQAPNAILTEDGTADALILARRLAALGADAAYASPFRRAGDSVAPFASSRGLAVTIDERLAERVLEAVPSPTWLDHVRRSFEDEDFRASGGETLAEARARGLAALARIAADGHACPAAATHGNLLSSIPHWIDPAFGFDGWRTMTNPDLFQIRVDHDRPVAFERLAWC